MFMGPLHHVPSPLVFQLFPWYFEVLVGLGQSPQRLSDFHRGYGPVFRTGWRRVMVVSALGAKQMYLDDTFLKSRLYAGFSYFGENLLSQRDPVAHRRRKRIIGVAFTPSNLKRMEGTIMSSGIVPLLENLRSGGVVNICHQLHCMTWDVMGELALGGSFGLVRNGHHPAMDWLASVTNAAQVAYLFPFLKYFPSHSLRSLHNFTRGLLDRPSDHAPIRKAISSLSPGAILAESHLMLFGGTDTASNAITFLLHFLIHHPQFLEKVTAEIDALPTGQISYKSAQTLAYLTAAIKETLRLLPPVAGTPLRIVPKGGWSIHGYSIPENTEVGVPTYALHRSPGVWTAPDQFHPERWLTKGPAAQELAGAYMPFLMGPFGCIGRGLAWMEMLTVAANLLREFHLSPISPAKLSLTCDPTLRPKLHQYFVRVDPRQVTSAV
ncbi:hypothetical protein DSO57_1005339 [Entomophthora muscae]|uniref:Uncharacterized protein n=1 Tax=Entomophthora muscae TaxID=34485 RepID=A0ACC2RMM9_9FUNG|nr:hypothetical protein DSO57_1005339 [Entomophthora muscae]